MSKFYQPELSSAEEEVFALLGEINNQIYDESTSSPHYFELQDKLYPKEQKFHRTGILVIGGWVRDKLMNRDSTESHDIDLLVVSKIFKEFIDLVFEKFEHVNNSIGTGKDCILLNNNIMKNKRLIKLNFKIYGQRIDLDIRELGYRTKDILWDMETRDFTMNSIYYDFINKRMFHYVEENFRLTDINILPFEKHIANKTIKWIPMLKEKIFKDPCRILRAIRFESTLQGFKSGNSLKEYFRTNGANKLKKSVYNKKIQMDFMSMVSNDDTYVEAIMKFFDYGLVPGLFFNLKIQSEDQRKTPMFRETLEQKMKLFHLLEKFLHDQDYEKKHHYWMLLNLKRPLRLFMFQLCLELPQEDIGMTISNVASSTKIYVNLDFPI